jgi:hypothetical protein
VEQLLVDSITSPTPPDITTWYYSQLLMAQRLQHAELKAELYRAAIERDGLCLLEGMYNFLYISHFLAGYLQNV